MTTTLEASAIWNWTTEKSLKLDTLVALKCSVLSDPILVRAFSAKLNEIGDERSEPRTAGLARWVLGNTARAYSLLAAVASPDAAVNFAKADCCLRGPVSDQGAHSMRRPDIAASTLASMPEHKSDNRVQALHLEALLFDHDIEAVRQALAATTKEFRASASGRYVEGRIHSADGEHDDAESAYRSALEMDPTHRPTLLRNAYELDLAGREEEAIRIYRRLATMQPADTHALMNLGVLHEDRGEWDEAVRCYRRVLDAYPLHSRANAYLQDARASINMVFDEETEQKSDRRAQLLRIPIADFDMSVRSRNCLSNMGVETLGDLVVKTEAELMGFRNFGETSLLEIKKILGDRGLRLGMNLAIDELPPEFSGEPVEGAAPAEDQPQELPPGVDPAVLSKVFADFDLSIRLRKALASLRIVTVSDVLQHTEGEFLQLKNCGQTTTNELKQCLAQFGISLRL